MELLLNLVWLLLAVPAYWLWRESGSVRTRHSFSARQVLLALTCVLVLLFPVISATDDLHAMRAEIEESPCSKRSVRQVSSDRVSGWNVRLQTALAFAEALRMFVPGGERANITSIQSPFVSTESAFHHVGRAPPHAARG